MQNDWSKLGMVIRDPGAGYDSAGSTHWLKILAEARNINADFYYRLCWLRDVGCRLAPDVKFKYRLEPVIGAENWCSKSEWDKEKSCLNPCAKKLIEVLKNV